MLSLNGSNQGKVFCLPDGYEVTDASLNDIKYNLKPIYNAEMLTRLDRERILGYSLEGNEFITGVVGLNDLKKTSFANCII